MAGLQPLSTRAFGPRLRRLTALTALATRPLIATKRSTARCGQSVCKCHAEKFRSAIFARILTAVHTRTICEAERLSRRLTMGANKPVAPASLLQVGGAGRVVGKKSLELWERLWEPKIATLVNVHEHGRTLPLVAVGDNRIGKLASVRGRREAAT